MLKVQLHSKFQVADDWQEAEDLLTGDFFGVLDYLPRKLFFADFLRHLQVYDKDVTPLGREEVEWENVEFGFWPLTFTDDEKAEPDLIVVSNQWLIVFELKLDSGLGVRQPWREYVVGRQLAHERGLSPDCVRYVVVARGRPDIHSTFAVHERLQRDELLARSYYVRWCDLVTMIESWLRHGVSGQPLLLEQTRILEDLLQVMRKRRNIAFEGFAFTNQDDVTTPMSRFFCPPSFEGFMVRYTRLIEKLGSTLFLDAFSGFLGRVMEPVGVGRTWPVSTFSGFMQRTTRCRSQQTLIF